MARSRLNAWNENPDPATLDYHERQWAQPYGSTRSFADFIRTRVTPFTRIVDIGCGGGAATGYLSQAYPNTLFEGVDCSEFLIRLANKHPAPNLSFVVADAENLPHYSGVDGVVSLQTLHILPSYEPAIESIINKIHPRWMALSTLIWPGDIDCRIVINEHKRPRESYSNVYGLPGMKRFLKQRGYECTKFEEYVIDVDLPPNGEFVNPDLMKTYTLALASGGRMQCSGPLRFPWGFVIFDRC